MWRHLKDMNDLARDIAVPSTVQRAAEGDEVAFARIVDTHWAEMVRVAFIVGGDWDLAQDAAQAALWNAWRRLPSLREPDRLRPWLMAIVANEARAIARKAHRHPVTELRVVADRPDGASPDAIGDVDLTNALGRLSRDDRAIVALRYLADLDSGEIASLTGLSPSGVRTRLSRILDHLRKDLGDE